MTNTEKYIEVRSTELLKWLANMRLITMLDRVISEAQNTVLLPVYLFDRCTEVEESIAAYGKADDRIGDEEMWWLEYDDSYFRDPREKQLIKSSNFRTVTRIINEGYGHYLVSVRYNAYGRKIYKFMDNPRILEIKAEEDAKSHQKWLERQSMDGVANES